MNAITVQSQKNLLVVDATNMKLGRMASIIAKKLMEGMNVVVVNAEKAVITGSKKAILERYLMLIGRSQKRSIWRPTVWYPRKPENIVRYTIIRMLPRKKPKGREAAKRLKVFRGIPDSFKDVEKVSFEDALLKSIRNRSGKLIRYMTVGELSKELLGGREV